MAERFYDDELMHHGILGMKWGYQNGPPYPLDEGDHSASEKKAGWKKSLGMGLSAEEKAKRRTEKTAQKLARKQRRQEKADAKWEKQKAKILNKGDIKAAQKNANKLSNDEIRAVLDRYRTLNNLTDANMQALAAAAGKKYVEQQQKPQKQSKSINERARSVANMLGTARDLGQNGVDAYNTFAKVYNAINKVKGNGKKDLPVLKLEPKSDVLSTQKKYRNGKLVSETIKNKRGDGGIDEIIKNYENSKVGKPKDLTLEQRDKLKEWIKRNR